VVLEDHHAPELVRGERFVSDGDAATVTIPAGAHGRLRPALPPGVKVVERD